ncbi:hypothetical protein CAPGI0001_1376 [Capnocytophaga gingivalis ATCC 33624]|nr:hypothetical protein CAPGI0001_1376 [Capnocytophaga gingivalis ATCC 33624]
METKRVESLVVTCLDESSNLSDSTILKPFPPLGEWLLLFIKTITLKTSICIR